MFLSSGRNSAEKYSWPIHINRQELFTQSLMRPPPGFTSAHFALMSAAQTPIDRSFAIATGAERSTTAPITMILFIIGHSPKRKKDANALTHLASVRCAQTNRLCMVDDKNGTLD
jgi:hypothetical protein